MCCAEMVHKNKGMDMDKRQEFMHKLIFDRRGKLADHTIVSLLVFISFYAILTVSCTGCHKL